MATDKSKNTSEDLNQQTQKPNSYDEVLYESGPFNHSYPENLRTIGLLFGMSPPKLEKARILELGSSAGGNAIPFAVNYPNSEVVCVDLSKKEIEIGEEFVKKNNIKNVKMMHASIGDIDNSFGKFDYIISHGVFSWVPQEIQNKMFEISKNLLNDNGIAYISYNALPGWNIINSIRDMMLFHSKDFNTPQERIGQARALLDFTTTALEGSKTPYAEALKTESDMLKNQSDHYLYHDHLSSNNNQVYFHQFIEKAEKNDLQYLAEASLSSMYLGNMPEIVKNKFSEIKNIVRLEQYMDFITNRRFRSTLLCKKGLQLNRSLTPQNVENFYFSSGFVPSKPEAEVDLQNTTESLEFNFPGRELKISTTSSAMKAILYSLTDNNYYPIKLEDLVKQASAKCSAVSEDQVKAEFLHNVLNMIFSGFLSITSEAPQYLNKVENKPKLSDFAMHQIKSLTNQKWITNKRHEKIMVSDQHEVAFMSLMNGKNTKDQIIDEVLKIAQQGNMNVLVNGEKIEDEAKIRKALHDVLEHMLNNFKRLALLVSSSNNTGSVKAKN